MNLFSKQDRLIKGCKLNERSAQERLYKLFHSEMLRLCLRYLKSDSLAAEALNSGFLKVFQNINSFDENKGGLGPWIRTIMVRTCIDLGRKEAKFTEVAMMGTEAEDTFIMPDVLARLYAEDLVKAIRQLPVATQLVFNLSVIEGFSHKEIAGQLQIGESTSRWHLSEAKKQLKFILSSYFKIVDDTSDNQKEGK